jgi:hypothetical protein
MLALAQLTDWDTRYEIVASLVVAAATFVLLLALLGRTLTGPGPRTLAALMVSVIFFSTMQAENWLSGFQLTWFLTNAGLVAAVWALSTRRISRAWAQVGLAAAAALVATFSLASGIFVWLAAVPLLLREARLRRWLGLWLALAALTTWAYYTDFTATPQGLPSKWLFLQRPGAFLEYLATYFVTPLLTPPAPIGLVNAVALAYAASFGALLWYFWRRHRGELTSTLLPWLCLGGASLVTGVSTDVSRLGMGVSQAYSNRYTTMSQFLLITFIVVLFKGIEVARDLSGALATAARYVGAISLVALVTGVLVVYSNGVGDMRRRHRAIVERRHCALVATAPTNPCLRRLYPVPDIAYTRLVYLRTEHLSTFRH